ncbi:MAG: carbohydrate kinase family protein [Hydrogenophaga sp.]|jgi:adenosine kinase|uniref:carbohydrate kinase family protein n=1 Tax=Hydrogenophaga sp. TaxID=1904254 RepID=UPI0026082595|nr:carbohydrate kinase family protein [Hydrogenophaga sp.]MCV0438189.1 carbohydrate kinase family protein [Hydrogenophaga sp.]
MPILVCGSLAFDTIMTFEGRFAEQILPSQLHILNVSFLVPGLRREYGGCAGNIAYGLRQLGTQAVPLATLGNDGGEYLDRLRALGVDVSHVSCVAESYTAQAMIMTDRDNNQITAFHPGAMSMAHDNPVPQRGDLSVAIISPDGRDAMLTHARQLHDAGVPFVFDPGQGLPMFNGEELRQFIDLASWVTLNDYEARMLCDRTGLTLDAMAAQVRGLIVTLGAEGCDVWDGAEKVRVAGVAATTVVDPTGCGDAFRAALLHGLEQGWPLQRCAELGNRMGATKIASRGGQNYTI